MKRSVCAARRACKTTDINDERCMIAGMGAVPPHIRQVWAGMARSFQGHAMAQDPGAGIGAGTGQGRAGQKLVGLAVSARPGIVTCPTRALKYPVHQVDREGWQDRRGGGCFV